MGSDVKSRYRFLTSIPKPDSPECSESECNEREECGEGWGVMLKIGIDF